MCLPSGASLNDHKENRDSLAARAARALLIDQIIIYAKLKPVSLLGDFIIGSWEKYR